jgi:hypothetical protein
MVDTIYKTTFKERKCPRCDEFMMPIQSGTINKMHGHKLLCSKCGKFVGWGGKENPVGWKREYGKQSA